MLPGKLLVIGVTVTALFITGCAKKQKSSADLATQKSTSTQPGSSNATNSDDIFNEFYKDENGSSEKVNSKETFTPSGKASESNTNYGGKTEFNENGRYVLQVSTVRSHSFAEKIKNKLENAGFPAYVAEVENPTPALSGTYYRIRIGAFSTISAAREFGENTLKSLGYDYWIDNKSNDLVGIDGSALGNSGSSYSSDSYSAPAPSYGGTTSTESTETSTQSDNWVTSAPAPTATQSAATTTSSTTAAPAASGQSISSTNQTPQPVSNQSAAPVTNDATNKDSAGWGSSGW